MLEAAPFLGVALIMLAVGFAVWRWRQGVRRDYADLAKLADFIATAPADAVILDRVNEMIATIERAEADLADIKARLARYRDGHPPAER